MADVISTQEDANRVSISEPESLRTRYNDKNILCLFVGEGNDRFEFEAKHHLSIYEVISIVGEVCDGVVDSEMSTYFPELRDYYLRVAVLKNYTNLTLPEEDNRCWDLVYGTPIFAMVTGHDKRPVIFNGREYDNNEVIDVEQYEQILSAIDHRIEYAIKHEMVAEIVYGIADAVSDLMCASNIERGSEFHAP